MIQRYLTRQYYAAFATIIICRMYSLVISLTLVDVAFLLVALPGEMDGDLFGGETMAIPRKPLLHFDEDLND